MITTAADITAFDLETRHWRRLPIGTQLVVVAAGPCQKQNVDVYRGQYLVADLNSISLIKLFEECLQDQDQQLIHQQLVYSAVFLRSFYEEIKKKEELLKRVEAALTEKDCVELDSEEDIDAFFDSIMQRRKELQTR